MKNKRVFFATVIGIFFLAGFVFTKNTNGYFGGVKPFTLSVAENSAEGEYSFEVKKAFAKQNNGHISVVLSNSSGVTCDSVSKYVLSDYERIIELDLFPPEDKTVYGKYTRKGEYKLGPAIYSEYSSTHFGGIDIGYVEVSELRDSNIIVGEVHIQDIDNKTIEGDFEAILCK